jgi:hypothetical protein
LCNIFFSFPTDLTAADALIIRLSRLPRSSLTSNLAARLQALARPGTLVVADATRRQLGTSFEIEDLGPQTLAGFAEPQRAWRAASRTRHQSWASHQNAPLLSPSREARTPTGRAAPINPTIDCLPHASGAGAEIEHAAVLGVTGTCNDVAAPRGPDAAPSDGVELCCRAGKLCIEGSFVRVFPPPL